MKKKIGLWFAVVFGTILTGFLLINFAYSINTENMIDNLKQSKNIFKEEGTYTKIDGTKTSTLDNFSDSLMLLTAGYNGEESTLDKAMNNYRYTLSGRDPCNTFKNVDFENPEEAGVASYARYWHGYLIFLKPLLTVMDYSEIRIFNMVIQILLLIAIVFLMIKRKIGIYAIPLISTFLLVNPITIFNSMQYSSVWIILYISIITYLKFKDFIVEKKLHYLLFTLIGMATSYFDLLTCPIITLGFPLIITLIAEDLEFKDAVKRVLSCSFLWIAGYIIMFASKWIIATIILNKNIIEDALKTVESRSSNIVSGNYKTSRMTGIFNTFDLYDYGLIKYIFIFNIIINIVWHKLKSKIERYVEKDSKEKNVTDNKESIQKSIINTEIKSNEKSNKKSIKNSYKKSYKSKNFTDNKRFVLNSVFKCIPILGVACMPFVWYFAISNHSQVHSFFTFRTASIFWFGILIFMCALFKNLINKKQTTYRRQ